MRSAIVFVALSICAYFVLSVFAETDWVTFRDKETHFRFLYPPDWTLGKPRGANVRATLFSQSNTLRADCTMVVRSIPELESQTQAYLNQLIERSPLSEAEWSELMEGWPDFHLIESRLAKVDNQSAYYGIFEVSHESLDRKTYMKIATLATFTPGHMYMFSCAGKGNSQAQVTQPPETSPVDMLVFRC